jgi:hypothetical protein
MAVPQMTWPQVISWRLRRQVLARADSMLDEVELARRISGLHAQLASAAELAAWVRTRKITGERLRAAVDDGRLVKVWAVRGTLHLLPADDWPMWVGALSTRTAHEKPAWLRYHQVSQADMDALFEAVPQVLAGRCLTRERLAAAVAQMTGREHLVEVLRSGWGAVLKPLAHRGLVCFGPDEGRNVTFAAPADRLPGWTSVPPEEALPEVLRRYLSAYGPSTPDELYRWSAIHQPVCRRLFRDHSDELTEVDVAGERRWLLSTDVAALEASGPSRAVLLLPPFDPFVIGVLRHLDHVTDPAMRDRISRTSGWISATLVVAGRIAGTWTYDVGRHRVAVTVTPFRPLGKAEQRAAERHAASYADGWGLPVDVTWDA